MKIKIYLFVLLALTGFFIFSEEAAPWQLIRHPFDTDAAQAQINTQVQAGYMPVGLYIVENQFITVTYVRKTTQAFSRWLLLSFDNLDTFEAECTSLLLEGWLPVDLSRGTLSIFMLWLNLEQTVTEWKVTTSENTYDAVKKVFAEYAAKGFTCYGISSGADNRYWYLFLKTPGAGENRNEIVIVPDMPALIRKRITEMFAKGWTLGGLTMKDNQYNFLFRK